MSKSKSGSNTIRLNTAVRDAFIAADPKMAQRKSGVIYRKQMWNRSSDGGHRKINKKWARPNRTFVKPELNRKQMYDFSRR